MDKRPRTVVSHIVEFVALTELRRLIVVVGVSVGFAALLYESNSLGTVVFLLAAGLATFLYTRTTAQKTIAASAYGAGVLMTCLFLLELYWTWSQASTEPLIGAATRILWRAVTGTLLIGLGLWLRQVEF